MSLPLPSVWATERTAFTNFVKSSPRATKSVWQLTSTMTPVLPSALTHVATSPSVATLPARDAALTRPFLRMISTAFSMSPSASVSAFLQSVMPADVRSRSSLIRAGVMSLMMIS